MAVVIIQDWPEEETERSTANYDEISRRLEESGAIPPEGAICTAPAGRATASASSRSGRPASSSTASSRAR